jgi:hypothetical protein
VIEDEHVPLLSTNELLYCARTNARKYPLATSCLDISSSPFASYLLLISGRHKSCSPGFDWVSVRYAMVLGTCLAAVLQASLVSLFVAVLLSFAEILLRGLWRVWMHGGEERGSGAGSVFAVVGGMCLEVKGSAVSIGEIGRTP